MCDRCDAVHPADELEPRSDGACPAVPAGGRPGHRLDSAIPDKRRRAFEAHTEQMIDRITREWGVTASLTDTGYRDHRLGRDEIEAAYDRWRAADAASP